MININLLPEVMRKKDRLPLPQFLGLIAALLLLLGVGFLNLKYWQDVIPGLENRKKDLESQRAMLQAQAEELRKINNEIGRLREYVDTVRGLYINRTVWSKILADVKNIVSFDPAMSHYNSDMRYIWLTKFTGRDKSITLNGFATAMDRVVAIQMPERLLQGFLTYAPVALPEKEEEEKLREELRNIQMEYDALRREQPDLPLQSKAEQDIRTRLEEIANVRSGGIALRPFASLLSPGSLRLINATWTNSPGPRRGSSGELFPEQAWSFGISMELK